MSTVKVLLIEDSPSDALLLSETLRWEASANFDVTSAGRLSQGIDLYHKQHFDIILLDLGLPDSQGIDTFRKISGQVNRTPVVVLSGLLDEAMAIQAVQYGAQDYLVKGKEGWMQVGRAIRYAIERQQSQDLLRASELRFRALIEHSADGIALLDSNGAILYESPALERILGVQARQPLSENGFSQVHPDDLFMVIGVFKQVLRLPGVPMKVEARYKHPDGTWHWIEATGTNLLDEPGVQAVVANYREITDRKAAEEALVRSEGKFRSYIENAPLSFFVIDKLSRYVEANRAAEKLLGYSEAALQRKTITELVSDGDRLNVIRDFSKVLSEGNVEGEYQFKKKDGNLIWISVRAAKLNEDQVIAFCQDISEKKAAEKALTERAILQDQLARLAETVPGMITSLRLRLDGSTCMPYATRALQELFGLRPEEVRDDATPALSLIHPDDTGHVFAAMSRSASSLTQFRDEWRVRHPQRGEIWVEANMMPVLEPDGSVFWQGFMQDITERKLSEKELREREEKYRTLFDNMTQGVFYQRADGVYLDVNSAALEMLGLTRDQVVQRTTQDLGWKMIDEQGQVIPPKQFPSAVALKLGIAVRDTNAGVFNPNLQDYIWVSISAIPQFKPGEEKPDQVIVTLHNVNDLKHAEQALREREMMYRAVIETSGDGFYIVDLNGCILEVNDAYVRLTGYSREELLKKRVNDLEAKENPEETAIHMQKIMREGSDLFETLHTRKDGSVWQVEANVSYWPIGDGRFFTFLRDITQRKLAEKALVESEERLSLALEASQIGVWEWDIHTDTVFWSQQCYEIAGLESLNEKDKSFIDVMLTEDLELSTALVNQAVHEKTFMTNEFRIVRPNGDVRMISNLARASYGPDGRPLRMVGTLQDITERKRTEIALFESQALTNAIVDSTEDMIWSVEPKNFGLLTFNFGVSNYFLKRHGIRVQTGMLPGDLFPDEDFIQQWNDLYQRVLRDGPYSTEYLIDGGSVTLQLTFNLMKRDGKVFGISVFGKDITERKQAEDLLRESEARYRLIAENTGDVIWILDGETMRFRYVSPSVYQLRGYTAEEVMAQDMNTSLTPDSLAMVQRNIPARVEECLKGVRDHHVDEVAQPCRDGSVVWTEVATRYMTDEKSGQLIVLGVSRDITERRLAEERVSQLTNELQVMLDTVTVGISHVTDRKIEWANAAHDELFGYTIGETRGMLTSVLYTDGENFERIGQESNLQLAMGKTYSTEMEMCKKDGTRIWCSLTGRLINVAQPDEGAIWMSQDITERKRAEDALRESELRFRTLIEQAPVAITITRNGIVLYSNQQFLELYGMQTSDEVFGQPIVDYFAPPFKEVHKERLRNYFLGLPVQNEYESVGIRRDGSHIPIYVSVVSVQLLDGWANVAFVTDLTERKRAEERLELLKYTIDVSPDGAYWLNPDGVFLYVNDSGCRTLGYSLEELLHMRISDINLQANPQRWADTWHTLRKNKVFTTESVHRRKDGSTFPVEITSTYVKFGDKEYCNGFARDITERKQVETERQTLSEIMQGLVVAEDLPEFLRFIHHAVGKVVKAENFFVILFNPKTKMFEEVYSVDRFDPPMKPSRLDKSISTYVFRTGKPLLLNSASFNELVSAGEVELVGASMCAWLGAPLITSRGVIGVMAVQDYDDPACFTERDMDFMASIAGQVALAVDRKLAETEVFNLNHRMDLILTSAGEGIYGTDKEGRVTFTNPALAKMLGWEPEELVGQMMHNVAHHTRSDGRPYPMQECSIYQACQKGENHHSDSEVYWRKDGTSFPVEYTSTPIQEGGAIMGTVVVVKDVSERRKEEEEGRLQAARIESLAYFSQLFAASSTNYQSVLDILARRIAEIVGDSCLIHLKSEDGNELKVAASYHPDPEALTYIRKLRANQNPNLDTSMNREVFKTGKPVLYSNMTHDQAMKTIPTYMTPWVDRYGMSDLLFVPMQSQGQVTGTLALMRQKIGHPFTEEEITFLQDLADRAALAIANAQLFDQVQHQNIELELRVAERTIDLSRANAELERTARAKDEFLASMSHELRTPLNAVLTLAESLEEGIYGTLDDGQLKPLRTISDSGHHLLNLINDILDLSKIEAGKLVLQISQVEINMICQSSLQLVRYQAEKKHIQVTFQTSQPGYYVDADARCLKQMLVNLLSNAVKFTPENGKVGLEVEGDAGQGVVHFSVWDTGIGIEPVDSRRLFQPFVQVDSGLARQYGGTGLGLALVYRMAELHGGSVSLMSSPGEGSRFTISLPWMGQREVDDGHQHRNNESTFESKTLAPKGTAIPSPVILIAEDNLINQGTIADYLIAKGYRMVRAANGSEVLERAAEIRPDLILMDIQMPGMDGLEAMRRLRAGKEFSAIPIIALTALAMPGDRERCLAAGAVEYIPKPVSLKNLSQVIEAHLRKA